jgi:nitrogen-specific signal transduction histidine kinase
MQRLKLAFEEVSHRAKIQRHFSEVPQVLGDETRLVQVMLNLGHERRAIDRSRCPR